MNTQPASEKSQVVVRAEHSYKGQSATAVVKVWTAPGRPAGHQQLAGSRAWLALGQEFLKHQDPEAAIYCARAGLAELGDDYTDPQTVDDTGMKLLAAQERIKKGFAADGATVMLRMLETRTKLYAKLHAAEVAE